MTIQERLIEKYGDPSLDIKVFEARNMVLWDVPLYINTHVPAIPNKIYCNKDAVQPLQVVFYCLIELQLSKEIKTWDGCFNVRLIRGSKKVISNHSFGLAVDLNAAHNPLGLTKAEARAKGLTPFSDAFDDVWRQYGWTCGIDFHRMDGMHREYIKNLI